MSAIIRRMRSGITARATGADSDLAACLTAFEAQREFVRRALRRQGMGPDDAQDLEQEVFLVLWRRWAQIDSGRPLRPWLSMVVLKLVQQYRRRERRYVAGAVIDRADDARSIDDQLNDERERTLVAGALSMLSEKQRQVVVMHDLEGLPMRDVAARLAVPLFTAYTRLRSGRRELASAIVGRAPDVRRSLRAWLSPWWIPLVGALAIVLVVGAALRARTSGEPPPVTAVTSGPRTAGSPEVAQALARGLVGYWSFDEAPADRVVLDRSGGGNHCLLRSDGAIPARRIDGVMGGALALDGHSWLECPRVDRLAGLGRELTIAMWIRTPGGDPDREVLITRQLGTSGDRLFSLRLRGAAIEFISHAWQSTLRRPLVANAWVHVVAVRDAAGTQLFLDGVPTGRNVTRVAASVGGGSAALMVGGQVNGPEPGKTRYLLHGAIDELALYDRALGEDEIAALAARTRPAALR
jgi:RNA polymerase sigma-70 factor (ECF subfamily)